MVHRNSGPALGIDDDFFSACPQTTDSQISGIIYCRQMRKAVGHLNSIHDFFYCHQFILILFYDWERKEGERERGSQRDLLFRVRIHTRKIQIKLFFDLLNFERASHCVLYEAATVSSVQSRNDKYFLLKIVNARVPTTDIRHIFIFHSFVNFMFVASSM